MPLPGPDAAWTVLQDEPRIACTQVADEPWCRAVGTLAVPIERVATVLEDMPKYADRFPRVVSIRQLDDDTLHVVLDYPVGLSDRDYVAKFTRLTEGDARLWRFVSVTHKDAPPADGVVRLPRMAGEWRLEPAGAGTKVTYTWEAEILGSFPSFLLDRARTTAGNAALADLEAALR